MSIFSDLASSLTAEATKLEGEAAADYKEVLTKAASYFSDAEAKLTAAVKLVQGSYTVFEPIAAEVLSAIEAAYPAVKVLAAVA